MKNNILLIDNDSSTRASLADALKAEHYNVFCAENRRQAIEQHGVERVNLLVVSLDCGEKIDPEAISWLSRVDRRLPLIALTSNSTPQVHLDPTAADALLERPFSTPLLLERIAQFINESKEAREARVTMRRGTVPPFVPGENDMFCGVLRARADTPYFCDRSTLVTQIGQCHEESRPTPRND
jgi:DNA-binding response OmpR family regulator